MSSPTPRPSDGPRFAFITPTNHAGPVWIASVLCLIYATLTLVVRGHIKWNLYGLDDWLIAAATATQLGQVITVFIALQHGLGHSDDHLSAADIAAAGKATFTSQIFFILSLCLAKCSVLTLMMRLFNLNTAGSGTGRMRSKTWVACNFVLVGTIIWAIASVTGLSVACSPDTIITDSSATKCPNQLLRWRLVMAFDIVTELVLVALPAFIVWPVQMSFHRKGQVVTAFAFRLPVAAFAALHLHYVGSYVSVSNTSLAIVPAVVWQQIELCWSLMSASIPNLKSFMRSFSTGLGMEGDLTTHAHDLYHRSTSRDGSQGHQLQSLRSRPSTKGDQLTQRSTGDQFRPNFGQHFATVEQGNRASRRPRDASSIASGGSQDMIIQKDVTYNVRYEEARR